MGCGKETIEETGSVWAENLDGCGQKALEQQGYETVQVDWKPVAGGDKQMQELLAILGGF